ncbi:Mov34/MPN/PAD-1 family protein [Ureibacillus chungkukjangi]|uniref:Integrative and conjugative element protein (TIGR02256 family) n=1 Tax=Ureibacillus chungkukjangi TaxID=1202712 RepID=A0A318TSP8_9BACL|nr:Mov34/MPN/PAD-1 family protein [Ureibacillus chungkukjangi]PYF07871.1 integrative and conjugative element protein (TIGR02256 family) [Ureibacillus chungkukjangi]
MISIEWGNIVIEIEEQVIKVIQNMRQDSPTDKESGGMLIGSILTDSNDFVIRDYTFPQKEDYQSRYRFIRREKSHNALLQKKWKESNNTVMYLGEWHTHPEMDPHYSLQDIRNWRRLLRKSKTFSDYLVFIIGGISIYRVWIGSRENGDIELVYEGAYNESNKFN